jgi:hypothetical protein
VLAAFSGYGAWRAWLASGWWLILAASAGAFAFAATEQASARRRPTPQPKRSNRQTSASSLDVVLRHHIGPDGGVVSQDIPTVDEADLNSCHPGYAWYRSMPNMCSDQRNVRVAVRAVCP